MNSVRGAAMHEARVNKARGTLIAFMNEAGISLEPMPSTLVKVVTSRKLGWEAREAQGIVVFG